MVTVYRLSGKEVVDCDEFVRKYRHMVELMRRGSVSEEGADCDSSDCGVNESNYSRRKN